MASLAPDLDLMRGSESLETDLYNPEFDHLHLSPAGQHSPYLTDADDFLGNGLFAASAPAYFVQPPTRNNSTILSPPLDSLGAFRYQFPKDAAPEPSVSDDHLDDNDILFGHRSRTHSRASAISSFGIQKLVASMFSASTLPVVLPGDVPPKLLSPLTDLHNVQIGDQWGGSSHKPQSATSTSNGSEPAGGSNVPPLRNKPQSPPALVIPTDPSTTIDLNASLFEASQPGLFPPPSLGLIPATPVTPPANQPKLGFQEILRQQVAQRRAASPLLSGSQPSDNSGSQVPPPTTSEPLLQQTSWSTLIPQQPPMSPAAPVPSLSDSNLFPHIGGPRPALGVIPAAAGASNLGVYTTRSRSNSDPLSSQSDAALPPAIRPSPTHGQGNVATALPLSVNIPGVNPNILGTPHVPDLNIGVGGPIWDSLDPALGLTGVLVQRARSGGSHIVSGLRVPELGSLQSFTSADGSLTPPSMSVLSPFPTLTWTRVVPYLSPNHSPSTVPDDDNISYGGIQLTKPVERVHVTTPATREASSNRRTAQANFKCPIPGCGSTFARHFDLRGHIRGHGQENTGVVPLGMNIPGFNPGDILGTPHVPDLNIGVGGSLWDDPLLDGLPSVQRAGSNDDNHRGHIRGVSSEDVSGFRVPDWQSFNGSLAPPSMSVPSPSLSDLDIGAGSSQHSQLPSPATPDSTRPKKKRKKKRVTTAAALSPPSPTPLPSLRRPPTTSPSSRAAGKRPMPFSAAPRQRLSPQPAPPKPHTPQPSPSSSSSGWEVGEEADRSIDWLPEEREGEKRQVESHYELPLSPALTIQAGDDAESVKHARAPIQTGLPYDSPNLRFYSANNPLRVARFENDPELLDNIRDLGVPVLENVVWKPNDDEMLQGGFGYVERAVWNNQDVAVKFLKGSQTVTGKARGKRSFRRELIAWSKLTHPNILPFLGVVCVENMFLGMVSPYMQNGCAPIYIAKNPEANVLQTLYDVVSGMSHLAVQRPPIAHGDIKGANVLIDHNGRARICDFGLSQLMKDFQSIDTTFGGTIRWMAPEQLVSETILVSLSADIYSWGMLALELMTGNIPWSEVEQDYAVVVMVCNRDERPGRPTCETRKCRVQPECTCLIGDDALWALIQRCWLLDPNQRPTVAQLCEELALNLSLLSHMDTRD